MLLEVHQVEPVLLGVGHHLHGGSMAFRHLAGVETWLRQVEPDRLHRHALIVSAKVLVIYRLAPCRGSRSSVSAEWGEEWRRACSRRATSWWSSTARLRKLKHCRMPVHVGR